MGIGGGHDCVGLVSENEQKLKQDETVYLDSADTMQHNDEPECAKQEQVDCYSLSYLVTFV